MAFLQSPTLNYGNSATNPTVPTPNDGDIYYNTVLRMWMSYDALRAKWLSIEAQEFTFGRNGVTAIGTYFQAGGGGRIMSAAEGFYAFRSGTICSAAYTRTGAAAMTFDFVANGVSIATLGSVAAAGRDVSMNADFTFGNILAVLNSAGSANSANNVIGTFRVKWRV